MRIKSNRLFSYPVLTSMNDDYVNCFFKTTIKAMKRVRNLQISIECELDNSELLNLLEVSKAEIICHIECSKTKLRYIEKLELGINNIEIDSRFINENIEIVTFIIAKEDIIDYSSSKFNKDYNNTCFKIDRGQILAIASQVDIPIMKDIYDLSDVPSIITIVPSNVKYMEVNMDDHKIMIKLPKRDFDNYSIFGKSISMHTPILHSMVIVPTLTHVIDELIKRNDDFEGYSDRRWFGVLKKKIESLNYDFNSDTMGRIGSLQLVQEILESPLSVALENLPQLKEK